MMHKRSSNVSVLSLLLSAIVLVNSNCAAAKSFKLPLELRATEYPVTPMQKSLAKARENKARENPHLQANQANSQSHNLAVTSSAYFGTPLQGLDSSSSFIYDTNSWYTAVTSKYCDNCDTEYYDYYESSTAVPNQPQSTSISSLEFGLFNSTDLDGYFMADQICFSADFCTYQAAEFFLIRGATEQYELDGVISLAPWGAGPNGYVDLMWVVTAELETPIVAFDLGSGDIYFGENAPSANKTALYPLNLTTTESWVVDFGGAWTNYTFSNTFNYTDINKSGATEATIASSVTYIYLPEDDFTAFSTQLQDIDSNITCSSASCEAPKACSNYYETLPSLVLELGGTYFTVTAEGYLLDNDDSTCTIGIQWHQNDDVYANYVLGVLFFQQYYIVMNYYDTQTIELAALETAPSGTMVANYYEAPEPTPTPTPDDDNTSSEATLGPWEIVLICVLGLIIVMIPVGFYIRNKRARESDAEFAEVQKAFNTRYSEALNDSRKPESEQSIVTAEVVETKEEENVKVNEEEKLLEAEVKTPNQE